jgi:DnaJ-class molecular chaperone
MTGDEACDWCGGDGILYERGYAEECPRCAGEGIIRWDKPNEKTSS